MHGIILAAAIAASDGDLVGSCETFRAQPDAFCPVNLTAGQDYDFHAVEGDGTSTLRLLEPSGDEVVSITDPSDGNTSVEVRARVTGTYRLEARLAPDVPDGGAKVELYTDCRADATTRCVLDGKGAGVTTGSADVDGWRFRLAAGRHVVTFDAGYATLRCDDGYDRTNHKGTFTVWPRRATACLLAISRAGTGYHLVVR